MPYLTDLADACRKSGLNVVEVPGWKTRGHGPMVAAAGIVCHHTATSSAAPGDYPSLGVVRDGHAALAGPLSQLGLGRNGTVYVIAAGRCWHAGPADDIRYSNSYSIGIEAEHPGGNTPWPKVQYDAYVALVAALVKHYRCAPPRGHKEIAVPRGRKVDTNFDMSAFRDAVSSGPTRLNTKAPRIPVTDEAVARFQRAIGVDDDGDWGPQTDKQALALRNYLAPGRRAGKWDRKRGWRHVFAKGGKGSAKAARRSIQWALGVKTDGIWGPDTDSAFLAFRTEAKSR